MCAGYLYTGSGMHWCCNCAKEKEADTECLAKNGFKVPSVDLLYSYKSTNTDTLTLLEGWVVSVSRPRVRAVQGEEESRDTCTHDTHTHTCTHKWPHSC
jgi:hypothetical protein